MQCVEKTKNPKDDEKVVDKQKGSEAETKPTNSFGLLLVMTTRYRHHKKKGSVRAKEEEKKRTKQKKKKHFNFLLFHNFCLLIIKGYAAVASRTLFRWLDFTQRCALLQLKCFSCVDCSTLLLPLLLVMCP